MVPVDDADQEIDLITKNRTSGAFLSLVLMDGQRGLGLVMNRGVKSGILSLPRLFFSRSKILSCTYTNTGTDPEVMEGYTLSGIKERVESSLELPIAGISLVGSYPAEVLKPHHRFKFVELRYVFVAIVSGTHSVAPQVGRQRIEGSTERVLVSLQEAIESVGPAYFKTMRDALSFLAQGTGPFRPYVLRPLETLEARIKAERTDATDVSTED